MRINKYTVTLVTILFLTVNLWADYTFTTFSHPDSSTLTNAYDINNDGVVVGYYQDSSRKTCAFSYQDGVFTDTTYPGDYENNNHSINNNGQIAGYYYEPGPKTSPFHSYVYDQSSGFNIQQYPEAVKEAIHGINDNGDTVGWAWMESGFLSYSCLNGTFQELCSSNGDMIYAEAINNQSVIVGGSSLSGSMRGFINDNGNYTYLEHPDADGYTLINGINDAGQLVGMYRTGSDWSSWEYHGFIYEDGTFLEISVPGLNNSNTICHGINEYGDIVGTYRNDQGQTCGFIATIPEPATVLLLSSGMLCLINRRKHK